MRTRRITSILGFLTISVGAQPNETAPARYAIVIGVEAEDLLGPNQDACSLAKVLASVGGFRPTDIVVLSTARDCLDSVPRPPTTGQIRESIHKVTARMKKDDLLFFFFSGHGEFDAGQAKLLLARDGRVDDRQPALYLSELLEWLGSGAIERNLVIALDACRDSSRPSTRQESQDLTDGLNAMIVRFSRNHASTQGLMFFGTEAGAFSYSRALNPVGYFTWAMIRGLIGEASDKQGVVRLGALAKYIRETVPQLIAFDLQINSLPNTRDPQIRQLPEIKQIGHGIDGYEISKTKPTGSSFYFSAEVYMLGKDSAGRKGDFERRVDFISARVGLSETLPLGGDVKTVPGLNMIYVPYDPLPTGQTLDWLVKFTQHFGRMHRTYVLCAAHPERYGVKVDVKRDVLEVNALTAFSVWGHQMADLEDMLENGTLPEGSLVETDCSLRFAPVAR